MARTTMATAAHDAMHASSGRPWRSVGVEEPHPQCVFNVGNRLRHDRLGDRKTLGRLAHRPAFDDGHQDAEVAQLEPATDPLCTLVWSHHRRLAMGSSENRRIQLSQEGAGFNREIHLRGRSRRASHNNGTEQERQP